MKRQYTIFFLAAFSAVLSACTGDQSSQLAIVSPATGARVKFIHAIPGGPGVNILVNSQQFSGVLTTPPTAPSLLNYGALFPVNDYAILAAGAAKVDVVTPASGTVAQGTVISSNVTVEANKFYSVFAVGSATSPEAFVTEDNLSLTDTSRAYVRLVNLVANSTTGYDLGVGGTYASAPGNIAYKQASNFVPIAPVPPGGTPVAVQIRATGTTANLAPATLTFSPIKGRFYTYFVRGLVGGTSTQAIAFGSYTNR